MLRGGRPRLDHSHEGLCAGPLRPIHGYAAVRALNPHLDGTTPRGERVLARVRDERGITLAMALGVMVVLTIMGTAIASYSTSNFHAAHQSKANTTAYSLAEAGISDAMSKIYGQLNVDGSVKKTTDNPPASFNGISPTSASLFSTPTTLTYPSLNGSVTYTGTLNTTTWVWTIKAVGKVKNSGQTQTRTVTKALKVVGLNDGSDGIAWSRFYQDYPGKCLTIDTVTWPTSVSTRGDLCLANGATITGATTNVEVGGNVIITGPDTDSSTRGGTGVSSGSPAWLNPGNTSTSNNGYTTSTIVGAGSSGTLDVKSFGFTSAMIPASAIIRGITVSIERKAASSSRLRDSHVYLLKAGAAAGTDDASGNYWSTTDGAASYGSGSDLWGTTLTAADVINSGFGVRLVARNTSGTSVVGSVDYVSITITYTADVGGIGSSGAPVQKVDVHGTSGCKYNANTAHTPCGTADKVYLPNNAAAGTGLDPGLTMPDVDYDYWWANAKPGPKFPCTGADKVGTPPAFDNNAASTSRPDASLNAGGAGNFEEIAPNNRSYTCRVRDTSGAIVGELSWNYQTHVLTIAGTIFIDGDFRFDVDGEVVNYFGRADIFSAGNDEIDAMVCAGGSGTTLPTSCASNMSGWNPKQNMLVLLSMLDNEYDQGGSGCSPYPSSSCIGGHPISGFQGVLYSKGDCLIHENFKDSGPVVCNTITLPKEQDGLPTYYPYPALTDLTDGQKFSDTATATNFELDPGQQTG